MLHGLTILRLDADAIITRLIFIIFDESNPKRFHLGGTDLSIAPVVVADGFRVSSARRCFVESASGPRLPGDDPLVVAKESANLDSTKAEIRFEDLILRIRQRRPHASSKRTYQALIHSSVRC